MESTNSNPIMVDEIYEFSAPKFFDFNIGESKEDINRAELWFQTSLSYAPSPFIPKIKTGRFDSVEISFLDFSKTDDLGKVEASSSNCSESTARENVTRVSTGNACEDTLASLANSSQAPEACTPNQSATSLKQESLPTNSNKTQTAKRVASLVRNLSSVKPKNQSQISQVNGAKPTNQSQLSHVKGAKSASARSVKNVKNVVRASDFAQENQAIKRQKLDEGRSRQILDVHPQNLPHKSRPGSRNSKSNLCPLISKTRIEDRKVYVREQVAPFISNAELIKKFQSGTRNIELNRTNNSLSHDDAASVIQRKPKLTLTRPTEPAFETAQRVRSVRVKSSAELEEEMMLNIPKFKARPINKKIFEAPNLPPLSRSTPQLPEFQEFRLKTTERANQHAETSTVVSSTESSSQISHLQSQWNPNKLTEPKPPRLETSLRARPPKVKSTQELEQEELQKIPKFKARPLNKKIFESNGAMGMFCNSKIQVTKPQEFHFATDERIPPTKSVFDLFDKLSLSLEPRQQHQCPRITAPNPFHLHTEERGAEKEKRFAVEVSQKQYEEERARIPKATPYPYTTDYPVIPPKPEPKPCTKVEPFQLESLTRHEEELQREMEERRRMEKEEARMRIFKAHPVLKEDPIPVPEKERIPLTQVQEFELNVDHRAVDRAEFDKKIKEKEMMYKRYREEFESAKMMEEEKALKQMRRTMVPQARPLPKFDNPFHPKKSTKETTNPKSPNLRVVRRKEKRRTMFGTGNGVTTAATSAAVSNMR